MKYTNKLSERGITLTILAITIVILMLLTGVIILTFNETDIVGHTEESVNTYYNEKKEVADEVDQMALRLDKSITKLNQEQVELIRNKIKTGALYTVNYEPQKVDTTVTVEGQYNGGLDNQTFNQTDTGAKGSNKMNWYVLSADVNEVKLVSSVSNKQIAFKDAGGYDNCLYYLNEISTKLFTNENVGVDSSKVHSLNLSDIKKAAEQMNGESYNWDTQMVQVSDVDAYNNGAVGTKAYTSTNQKYPQIYGTSTEKVSTNNPMYDEKVKENYEPISGDLIGSTSKTASKLTANQTFFYTSNNAMTKNLLGDFGSSEIGGELFNSSGTNYWVASRCVYANSYGANFLLRRVSSGCLDSSNLCNSDGKLYSPIYAFRVVVSVPASHVNVANDGTVTLKS